MNQLLVAFDGPVARITLRCPGARNALNALAVSELLQALENASSSPGIRAILLDAGGPVFCAGLELSPALLDSTIDEASALDALFTFGQRSNKPLVAAVQGAALGAGAVLAATAHVTLAAQGTSFGFTDIRAGLWPYSGWPVIEGAIGRRRALELTLTGRVFSSQDALAWGLIHEITQPSELEDRAMATASLLASSPPETVASVLKWLREPGDAIQASFENLQSAEAREGIAAYLEKRRPEWPARG